MFLQQLALLKGFDLGEMTPDSPEFIHTVVEVRSPGPLNTPGWVFCETVQDMFIAPLYQQHASHTLASRAHGPQPHMRS